MFHGNSEHDDLTQNIIGCAIRVHETFGPGLFESIYKACFVIELEAAGLKVDASRRVPLTYRGRSLDAEFCPDVVVEETVIVEIKAVEALARVHQTQLITYLKLTGLPVGLLMNFNVEYLKHGIRRVVRPDLYVRR
jgi:GxxExxY protein